MSCVMFICNGQVEYCMCWEVNACISRRVHVVMCMSCMICSMGGVRVVWVE